MTESQTITQQAKRDYIAYSFWTWFGQQDNVIQKFDSNVNQSLNSGNERH